MLSWFRKRQKLIFYAIVIPIGLMMGFSYTMMRVLGGTPDRPYFVIEGEDFPTEWVAGQVAYLESVYRIQHRATVYAQFVPAPKVTPAEALDRYVLLREAQRAGIEVPDAEVADRVRDFYAGHVANQQVPVQDLGGTIMETFQRHQRLFNERKGQVEFDPAAYQALLGGAAQLVDFERYLREEIQQEKLRELVGRTARTDPEEVFRRFQQENEKRSVDAILLQGRDYLREVDFVLRDDPQRYFERNRAEFVHPAKVGLEYVFLPLDGVEVEEPTEEEIQSAYDDMNENRPLAEVRDEVIASLKERRAEEKAQEILVKVRDRVEAGEELPAVAREEADVEVKVTETLALDGFQEIPHVGTETIFEDALKVEPGSLGEVGLIFEKGAYLYRVKEAVPSVPMTYTEVAEQIVSDVDELYQAGFQEYFERNEERYVPPAKYHVQYIRGPAGDDSAETRKELTRIKDAMQKVRRRGEAMDLAAEATGKLEFHDTGGPVLLEEVCRQVEIPRDELRATLDGVRGEMSPFPYTRQDHIYIFRLVEKIEEEVEFPDVLDEVEKDVAADTERAIQRAYRLHPDAFRTPLRVDGEFLRVDVSALAERVGAPTEDEIADHYEANIEAFALPEGEEDEETGSRYRPLEEVQAEIVESLRRGKAWKMAREILKGLEPETWEKPLVALTERVSPDDQPFVRVSTVSGLDPDEARDHAEIASGALHLTLEDLEVEKIHGPIDGDQGPFLFRPTARQEPILPPLEEVRNEVMTYLVTELQEALPGVYDETSNRHREPDRYEVEYLIARYESYLPGTQEPKAEEIQDYYDAHKKEYLRKGEEEDVDRPDEDLYKPLEEVREEVVRAIRLEEAAKLATADLEKARAEMDKDKEEGGEIDFSLYRTLSERLELVTPDPIERVDLFYHDDLNSTEARSIPRMEEGEITDIVENTYKEARFILRLEKKHVARIPEMEEVRSKVLQEYFLRQADAIVREKMEALREMAAGGDVTLREVAEKDGIQVIPIPDLERTDRYHPSISYPSQMVSALFRLDDEGDVTEVLMDTSNRHRGLMAQVVSRTPPSSEGFEEKRESIAQAMQREVTAEFVQRWETDLLRRARGLDEEILQKTYDEHFRNRVQVRRILVGMADPSDDLARREALRKAEGYYVRLLQGEPFSSLARKYSDDRWSSMQGGRIAPQSREDLNVTWGPEFAQAVVDTPVGTFSRPLEDEDGFVLILVEDKAGEEYHLRQIRVNRKRFLASRLEEQVRETARKEAEALRERIVRGEAFSTVALLESDAHDMERERGGDMGEIGYESRRTYEFGALPDELVDAILAAPVGEVSEPVKTQGGYHIIRVYASREVPLEEVRLQVGEQVIRDNDYTSIDPQAEKAAKEAEEKKEEDEVR